jgi:hypothetical protein
MGLVGATKKVLIFAAIAEAAAGLALLIVPSVVGQLLFGEELTGVATALARVTGIALIGLGVACWPGPPLGRHVDLQRSRHAVSFLRWFIRGSDRHLAVAGCRPALDPDGILNSCNSPTNVGNLKKIQIQLAVRQE